MATQIQIRRDTATNWTSINPILAEGELGLEKDTGKIKIGDGLNPWQNLSYNNGGGTWGSITGTLANQEDLVTVLNGKAPATTGNSILKGNGIGGFANAAPGTDYLTPDGSAAALTDFPILNQNTTGTAANLSGTPTLPNGTAASTQPQADNSTKLATTAYVDAGLSGKLSPTGDGSSLTGLTAAQVGLGNVSNEAQESLANKDQPNGYCGLDSGGKVAVAQLPAAILGALSYQGTLDASGGTYPANPAKGYYWVISVQGTLGGILYRVNDWLTYDGTNWDKIDNSIVVSSVAGKTGAVTLTAADVGLANVSNDAQIKASDFPSTVADGQAALFNGNDGKSLKASALTGIIKQTSGVPSVATPKTDYAPPTSGSAILKGDGQGGFGAATSGTDFLDPAGNGSQLTGITPSQVGLGNVSDDAQLKAAAGDFATFPEKTAPVSADLLLIEDAAASGAKKKVQVGNLPGGGSLPAQTGHTGQFLTTDGTSASWGNPSVGSAAWNAIASKPEVTVGDTGCGTTIQDALTAIGVNEKTLLVPPGTYAGPATVPSNVTIRFARGALLTSGTLTIQGELQAGDQAILEGGTLTFGATCRNQFVNPRWWGAKGDDDGVGGGTDDYNSLNAMVTALGKVPMAVRFFPGKYKIGSDITFPATVCLDFMKGAMLAPHVVAQTTTITNADVQADNGGPVTATYDQSTYGNTIQFSNNSTGLNATPGDSYVVMAGQRVRLGSLVGFNSATCFKLLGSFSGGPYSDASVQVSTRTVTISGAGVTLQVGDTIWDANGNRNKVARIVDDNNIVLVRHPAQTFSGSWNLGVRVTISGSFSSPMSQIFTGKGTVFLTAGKFYPICPEWWGAAGDNSTVCDAAFEDALWNCNLSPSGTWGCAVQLQTGNYILNDYIPYRDGCALLGVGAGYYNFGLTTIRPKNHANCYLVVCGVYGRSPAGGQIKGINFDLQNTTQEYPLTHIQQNSMRGLRIESNTFWGGDWAIVNYATAITFASDNFVGSINGIYVNTDSNMENNNIGYGKQLLWDFNYTARWTHGTHWTLNTSAKTATYDGDASNETLSQSISNGVYFLTRGEWYGLHFTISGRTTGSLKVEVGDTLLQRGSIADANNITTNGTFYTLFIPNTSAPLVFTPSGGWDGTLSLVRVTHGFGIAGMAGMSLINNNIAYGDGGGLAGGFLSSDFTIGGNRFDAADIGLLVYGGNSVISKNLFNRIIRYGICSVQNFSANDITDNRFDTVAMDSGQIDNYGQYGVVFFIKNSIGYSVQAGTIRRNRLTNVYDTINTSGINTIHSEMLIEENYGIDLQAGPLEFASGDATPSVRNGKYWKTNNASAVTITDFKNSCPGKEIQVRFGDSVTTLDFANTSGSSTLKGNKGVNVTVAAGDTLRAVKGDDGNWYCEYFDNTP